MSDVQEIAQGILCDKLFDWAFGDNEDDLNEALLQESDGFESEITPRASPPSLALAPSRAPSAASAACCQPNSLPLTNCLCRAPPVGLRCQKHHRGSTELHRSSTEIRATLLTNQIF